MPSSVRHYAKNWALFAHYSPLEACWLDRIDAEAWQFCHTTAGEVNLVNLEQEVPFYLHAQAGAQLEAQSWAHIQPLDKTDTLCVYGLGLGYYYLPLKWWLTQHSQHRLVFLEEDPRVVHRFLQTALATEILSHPQVIVQLLPCLRGVEDIWAKLRVEAAPLLWALALRKVHFSALQAYFWRRFAFFDQLVRQWYLNLSQAHRRLGEFLPNPHPALRNFYANMPYLPQAVPAQKLYGALAGVPAIICGAGPSLAKQLPILKQLKNRALILAAGSGMNAVTHANLMPHAGGAIDPTATQASRLLTSFAFDVPAFYKNRFYAEALRQWHGPLLYETGSSGFRLAEWFEKELGLFSEREIVRGNSTSVFLLEIAALLGCNPIILVGMDLAYTGEARYVEGVSAHPTDTDKEKRALTAKEEIWLTVPGIEGENVKTNRQWFSEAVFISAFQQRNPHILTLNATEGGMAIPSVPNIALQEIIQQTLQRSWDLQGWLHGLIQEASLYAVKESAVKQVLLQWHESMQKCESHLSRLLEELTQNQQRLKREGTLPYGIYTGRAALWRTEIEAEPVYTYLLHTLESVFETWHRLRLFDLQRVSGHKKHLKLLLEMEKERCQFLQDHLKQHIIALKEGLYNYLQRRSMLDQLVANPSRLETKNLTDAYQNGLHEHKVGPDSEVKLTHSLHAKEKQCHFYANGAVKIEAFYVNGQLHGPWSFFSETGRLLARSWYVNGKKQGKSVLYYREGALYSLQSYQEDQAHGPHFYYYPNGLLKTIESYLEGQLHGPVKLYYRNGQHQKELHFSHGLLHGPERMWEINGQLILEACYDQGRLIGTAKRWDREGRLISEVYTSPTFWLENRQAIKKQS